MIETVNQGSSRYRHYAIDLKRYYRIPAVQASLSTVLSLLITAFFIVVAIKPTFVTIAQLQRTIEDTSKTLSQLQAKEKAIQQAAIVWDRLESKVPYVETSIPSNSAEYNSFLKSMEYLAIQNGVTLTSENVGSALLFSDMIAPYKGKGREVVSLPVTLRVTGAYESVMSFYQQMTNIDRLIEVDSISLNNDTSVKNKGSLVSLSISGSIGYMADSKLIDTVIQSKDKN